MITVLFCRKDSIYKSLNVDCYDIERNALNFIGTNPVIAHPPCRAWGKLRHFAKPEPGEKDLSNWAVNLIRKNGGVLEHPRASKLWHVMNMPLNGHIDIYGGFSLSVNQSWWGHKCEKKTLLYICGCKRSDLPPMPLSFDCPTHVISTSKRKTQGNRSLPEVSKKEREATPINLAKWLIEVANLCK